MSDHKTGAKELLRLAEICEKASGASRELNVAISEAVGIPVHYDEGAALIYSHGGETWVREYTSSLDAALTLVPENYWWSVGAALNVPHAASACVWRVGPTHQYPSGTVATAALALCAASLRALAAKET